MTQLKTLAMKAKLANYIRKTLYKKQLDKLTQKEKLDIFDVIFSINKEMHYELLAYKSKRKDKKELYEARVKRGYKFKKKTSKKEYLENLQKNLVDSE